MTSKPAIFLHIPKTAGTTLHTIIDQQYGSHHIHSFGSNAQASIEEFKGLSYVERKNIRLLRGHMAFGLHEEFPRSNNYFTLLRDPVDRVVSYYNFILRTPEHYLYEAIDSRNLDLGQLMISGLPIMMNDAQVRLLSGVWSDVGYGKVSELHLEQAKSNLQIYFEVVGITEEFDRTLLLLRDKLSWPSKIYYERRNVTQNGMGPAIPPKTLELVRQFNQMDEALYSFAKSLFHSQVQEQGKLFPLKVKTFQFNNNLFALYQKVRRFSLRNAFKV